MTIATHRPPFSPSLATRFSEDHSRTLPSLFLPPVLPLDLSSKESLPLHQHPSMRVPSPISNSPPLSASNMRPSASSTSHPPVLHALPPSSFSTPSPCSTPLPSPSPSSSTQVASPLVSPNADDRDARLEKAVALVTSCRYSVRKAAHALKLPKSTVHRYIQATRGPAGLVGVCKRAPTTRRVAPSVPISVSLQASTRRPSKCDISFLIDGEG